MRNHCEKHGHELSNFWSDMARGVIHGCLQCEFEEGLLKELGEPEGTTIWESDISAKNLVSSDWEFKGRKVRTNVMSDGVMYCFLDKVEGKEK